MISLRKLTIEDSTYFMELNNKPDILKWMRSDNEYKKEDFLAILACDWISWYVIHSSEKVKGKYETKRVGLFTTYIVDKKVYLGIIIDHKYRRKGYARDTFKHYLTATDEVDIPTYLSCFDDQPALNMYKQLGYKEIGEEKVRGKRHIHMKRDTSQNA